MRKTGFFILFAILLVGNLVLISCDNGQEENYGLPAFEERSADLIGLDHPGFLGQTTLFFDYNNDNYLDLLFTTTDIYKRDIFLFKNSGGRLFFLPNNEKIKNDFARSLSAADCDGKDGVELAFGTLEYKKPFRLYKYKAGGFKDITEQSGITARNGAIEQLIWADLNSDGFVDVFQANNGINLLHENSGGCKFTIRELVPDFQKIKTNSATATDIDNDNDLDLFLANYGLNELLINNGSWSFEDISESAGIMGGENRRSMAVCSGDYDNDGYFDLYVVDASFVGNTLYRNNGDGTFTDVTEQTGTKDVGDGRTCAFVDFDSDGLIDIFSTNHFAPNKMYRNLGNGKFQDVAFEIGLNEPVDVFSAPWGDYNNDGFMDVFLNGHIGKGLFRNKGNSNNSIVIKLIGNGKSTNRSAIGSRVNLTTPNGITQSREVSGGKGATEQDMLPVHFGVGKEKVADIKITWTDGSVCDLKKVDVEGNKIVSINQSDCKMQKIKLRKNI